MVNRNQTTAIEIVTAAVLGPRNDLALSVSGLIGLGLFAAFPVAPPRFLPGYEVTVSDAARPHYLDYPLSWTNQVASFPSFHIGWTLIACLALAGVVTAATPGRTQLLRTVVMLPALLVGIAVVTTGNHDVLDAVAGTTIALGAFLLLAPERTPSSGREEPGQRPRQRSSTSDVAPTAQRQSRCSDPSARR